ncbi:hypothetical protein QE441_002868 [Chryseobacterium sp. SORGH_AS909]|uniref:Uncharacterized protein n=1 Tax=Chryseobacterium camelliae TaxID=1265445 RepID=A0ABU0TFF1_9FLAO|nr:hypothetical protein [Chryseobacterium camelliae]MDQ1099726.1 hypothetical protein [Chryseobacterium sp. SORGH_AS_1048]MDR6087074.1 hypothetical protein [Chryseobacterium sp. SORGH_AS_0909]MDR6131447.1 hypothetical protein [Chryseobacterium sp. SORGH_AS_1175]MDT3406411.1 hypothetical protein [Pseudacidovorax intermedius]
MPVRSFYFLLADGADYADFLFVSWTKEIDKVKGGVLLMKCVFGI